MSWIGVSVIVFVMIWVGHGITHHLRLVQRTNLRIHEQQMERLQEIIFAVERVEDATKKSQTFSEGYDGRL